MAAWNWPNWPFKKFLTAPEVHAEPPVRNEATGVITLVVVRPAPPDGVTSFDEAPILVSLHEVLWPAERDSVSRGSWQIAWHNYIPSRESSSGRRADVKARRDWLGTERLEVIQAVEHELLLARQPSAKAVRH